MALRTPLFGNQLTTTSSPDIQPATQSLPTITSRIRKPLFPTPESTAVSPTGGNVNVAQPINEPTPEGIDPALYQQLRQKGNIRESIVGSLAPVKPAGFFEKVKEIKEKPTQLLPFVGSAVDIYEMGKLKFAADRLAKDEATEQDLIMLKDYADKANRDTTIGYKILDTLSYLPAFIGEIGLTGGAATAVSAGARTSIKAILKKIVSKGGKEWITKKMAEKGIAATGLKLAERTAVGLAGRTAQAPLAGLTRIPALALQKQVNEKLTELETGEKAESLSKSLAKAFGEQWVETVSEFSGGVLGELFKGATNQVKNKVIKTALFAAFDKVNPQLPASTLERLVKRVGWNGVINEMLEERVADVGHGLLNQIGLSDQPFKLPSGEQLLTEMVAFSVPGMGVALLDKYGQNVQRLSALSPGLTIQDITKLPGEQEEKTFKTTDLQGSPIEQIFIREPKKSELTNPSKTSNFAAIPDKEGWEKVYKPYGEQGKGYYYVRKEQPKEFTSEVPVYKNLQPSNGLRQGQLPVGSIQDNLSETVARERFDIPSLKKVSFGGSDRDVYEIPTGEILKVAKTSRGLTQNASSADYYAEDSGLIPKTIEQGKNYLVKERVSPPDANTRKMVAEIKKIGAFYPSAYSHADAYPNRQKAYDIMDKYGYSGSDLANYDVLWGDIQAIRNWGTKDGKPILLDEGTLFGDLNKSSEKFGGKNLSDPEFRDIYNQSRLAKKRFSDKDKKTMYWTGDKQKEFVHGLSLEEMRKRLKPIIGEIDEADIFDVSRGELGEYFKGMIKLLQVKGKVSEVVGYHEAFHYVVDLLMTKQEKAEMIKWTKENKKEEMARLVRLNPEKAKKLDEDGWAEEVLANEFAKYVMAKAGKKAVELRSWPEKIINLFEKLIKKLSGIEENRSLIDAYFEKIRTGEFAKRGKQALTFPKIQKLTKILRGTKNMTADDIMAKYPNLKLIRQVSVTDIHGVKKVIPEGEALTPYELKGNKVLLQDGETYIVSKNQFQNIKGQSVFAEGKPFAPELAGTEETAKYKDYQGKKLTPAENAEMNELSRRLTVDGLEGADKARWNELSKVRNAQVEARDTTKFSQYQLPEGKNYKEILIKAPEMENSPYVIGENGTNAIYGEYKNRAEALAKYNTFQNKTAFYIKPKQGANFKSSHWDEPNVISHLRLNERTYKDKKVTFMEEMQSDFSREFRNQQKGNMAIIDSNWEGLLKKMSDDGILTVVC